ncbi:MAG: response regulator [Candidatus Fermentibacteraceae bacterium]|nr:response regulator [Candidatus Fermentibacteraceae bacterium]
MAGRKLIAVVDDEPDILELVRINLERAGFDVRRFTRSSDFMDSLRREKPDLVILDLMLPDTHGTEVCRIMRSSERTAGIPVIMLTAMVEEADRVAGLEMGADDYVTKPFSPRELVARVKAVLRRGAPAHTSAGAIEVDGTLRIDPERFSVTLEGENLELTSTEFRLLHALAEGRGRVFSRKKLLEILWQGEKYVTERTIDVHIAHLRNKLGDAGDLIENVRGIGYRLAAGI